LRAIQKDLDEGRSLPVINYIPLPGIGRKAFRKFGIDFGPKIRTLTKLSFAFTAPKFGRNQFSSYLCGEKMERR
jgi:hypothetical protein